MNPILYVFQGEDLKLMVSTSNEQGLPLLECVMDEKINEGSTLTFSVPSTHPQSQSIQSGDRVVIKDLDGLYKAFVVTEDDENHTDEFMRSFYCEELAVVELNDEIVEDVRPFNTTAEDALERILENTNWQVGNVDAFGNSSANVYYESAMEGISKVIEAWGGEIRFRVTMDTLNNKITGRYVDLFAQIGSFSGKRFEYSRNMTKVERVIDTKQLKTALYGRGKG
jgi:phage minor structural protein